jgi:nucleotide-binding universal stress UspA family protein
MYRHILVPTDGSQRSAAAAASAIRLAHALGARVTALHVMPELMEAPLDSWAQGDTRSRSRLRRLFEAHAQEYLAAFTRQAAQAGVPCATMSVSGGAPHEAVLEAAQAQDCDLIFMASHGRRGDAALLLGSETAKVLIHGAIPVLVHRTAPSAPGRRSPRAAGRTRR